MWHIGAEKIHGTSHGLAAHLWQILGRVHVNTYSSIKRHPGAVLSREGRGGRKFAFSRQRGKIRIRWEVMRVSKWIISDDCGGVDLHSISSRLRRRFRRSFAGLLKSCLSAAKSTAAVVFSTAESRQNLIRDAGSSI